jgi:hypothetical protein
MEKTCVEYIDLGFSIYTIQHKVFSINLNGFNFTQTIGIGTHDIGVLPKEYIVRIYNYPFNDFPIEIDRDANNPIPNKIDPFLLFENRQNM